MTTRSARYGPRCSPGANDCIPGGRIMFRIAASTWTLALLLTPAAGLADDKPLMLQVWPGKAPGETEKIGPEKFQESKPSKREVKRLTNVDTPTITVHRP